MRIPELSRHCVAHLYAADPARPGKKKPLGTAFGVGVEREGQPGSFVAYLVTARHVINGARSLGSLYVRFNTRDGGHVDISEPPDDWVCHDTADVAIMHVSVKPEDVDFGAFVAHEFLATDTYIKDNDIREGDDVFYVGLFSATAGGRNEPIIRFGKIAMARRHLVQIRSDPGPNAAMVPTDAYLVETGSWGGSSGAPVFLFFNEGRRQRAQMPSMTPLLGLMHGHFDINANVRVVGDVDYGVEETVEAQRVVGVNSGIAVVIPASAILELLARHDMVAWRRGGPP